MPKQNVDPVAEDQFHTEINSKTYFVFYADHDRGSPAGFVVRETLEIAERSASLFDQCGYRFTEVRHAASIADFSSEWVL